MSALSIPKTYLFSSKDLRKIILPLVTEQFLILSVSLADSIMVSSVGESAISAVSLMSNIFVLLNNIFVALATGGCVIASQYIGKKKIDEARQVGDQLLLLISISSVIVMALIYLLRHFIIGTVFGKLTPDVSNNCYTYLYIVTATIPFTSIYSAGTAMYRAIGNTKTPMIISLMMNIINIGGNAILIYGFNMGVAGAAIPTLVSSIIATITIYLLLRNKKIPVHFSKRPVIKTNKFLLRKILYIGIPNSFENSLFQLGKIMVLNMIAGFGTAAIAANSVANTITTLQNLPGISINIAMLTICARCFGAGEFKQIKYYTKRMLIMIRIFFATTSGLIIIFLPNILSIYNISLEAKDMTAAITIYYTVAALIIWPESFALPNSLRATNDVKYCMIVAALSMWLCRIVCSYVIGVVLGFGLFGVWVSMTLDWVFRAIFMIHRFYISKKSILYITANGLHETH